VDIKKTLVCGIISLGILIGSSGISLAQNATYTVKSGDTFWKIANKYGVSTLSVMNANNANENTILHPGQKITIPLGNKKFHTVVKGDTYWSISQQYGVPFTTLLMANNATNNSWLSVGDKVIIPEEEKSYATYTVQAGDSFYRISQKLGISLHSLMSFNGANEHTVLYVGQKIKVPLATQPPAASKPYVTYQNYTVQKYDTPWAISKKFGIPFAELLKANNLNESSYLNIGDVIKIPVHHVPIKSTPGSQYGEHLDWWTEAQYVIPLDADFEVVDFYTGKSFKARRTTGALHADCETLSWADTNTMKSIWGGNFSWQRRPVLIKINGRKIAASATAMPHAGNDGVAADAWASWRSGDYGAGTNYDYIKNNGMDGHFDIHFLNSTRHKDGRVDTDHQKQINIAAGR